MSTGSLDGGGLNLWVAPGTLLAAGTELLDPNFMHGVVLMCEHTGAGAYGIVVNKLSELTTRELLSDHPQLGAEDAPELPVFIGGPVGLDTLQVLHCAEKIVPGGVEIAYGVHLGGDLDAIRRYMVEQPEEARRTLRFTLGYAGWGAGQLEEELSGGTWLPAPGTAETVFESDCEGQWRAVVRSIGEGAQGLADQPPDPRWN